MLAATLLFQIKAHYAGLSTGQGAGAHTQKRLEKRLEKKVEMRKLNFQLVCHVCAAFRTHTGHRILDQTHTRKDTHTHTHGPLKGCLMNVWLARLARADERLAIKWEMLKIICITYAPRLTAYLMQLR